MLRTAASIATPSSTRFSSSRGTWGDARASRPAGAASATSPHSTPTAPPWPWKVGNSREVEYGALLAMKHDAHQMNMGWNIPKKKAAKKKRRQAKAKSAAAALEAIGALNTNAPPIPSGPLRPQVPLRDHWAQAAEANQLGQAAGRGATLLQDYRNNFISI